MARVLRRALVLRSVHAVLTGDADLVAALGDADRVIADDVTLEQLPVPGVILGFDNGAPDTREAVTSWTVTVDVLARDAFELANLLDHVEQIALEYRLDRDLPQPLTRLTPQAHQRFEAQQPAQYLVVRVPLRAEWI